jgi:glutamate dehydrogenase/leucine dehydrogenase
VTGVDPAAGGSGDPSLITAVGVVAAMRAVGQALDGEASVRGRRVAVQGAGHVGAHLVGLLVDAGASVVVGDLDPDRVAALVERHGVDAIAGDDAVSARCDVLAPCALGNVVTEETIDRLDCEIVCGGANNQLASESMDDALVARGILYAPDFVANAGGILNLAEEHHGYSRERALASAARIEATMARVLACATEWGIAPGRAAERVARERIESEALPGGLWVPGDPASWTEGAPLTRLRP